MCNYIFTYLSTVIFLLVKLIWRYRRDLRDYCTQFYNLLFLSNPLVDPDNNLCERKARILKGKINQAISLRSFEHLTYFCECLSVLDHFATEGADNLYQAVKEIFKRQRPAKPKDKKSESSNTDLSEQKVG